MQTINLQQKFDLFQDHWHPRILGEVNDSYVKIARLQGEFLWHSHANEDEFFLVIKGRLLIKLRDRELWLEEGEFTVIPKGVEHCPVAQDEVQVLLLEPKSTLHTGDIKSERSVDTIDWI